MGDKEEIQLPLANFQEWMMHMLLDPYQQLGKAQEPLPDALKNKRLDSIIHHSDKLPAHEHLAIYQRGYIARLRNCMAQQFSALEYALSEDLFSAFADEYLSSHPSTNYNLSALGEKFADFLQANRPDQGGAPKEDWPDFMIELCELENTINIAFDEKAEEGYELATTQTPDDKLELLPVSYLFKFRFPVRPFYTAFKKGQEPAIPALKESYAIVLRHNYQMVLYDLSEIHYRLFSLLKEGMGMVDAKAKLRTQEGMDTDSLEKQWEGIKAHWTKAKIFRVKV